MGPRKPLSMAEKQIIGEKKGHGESLRQISEELNCSKQTVRKWWRHHRDQKPVRSRGRPKLGALSTFPANLVEKAVQVKQAHPHWGPVMVNIELKQILQLQGQKLPSAARLSVLFKQRCPEAVQSRVKRLLPPSSPHVSGVHQRWQMDAKEGLKIGSDWVNVQEIGDVHSGLMIASQAFITTSQKKWRHLSLQEHQQTLRQAFSEWGLPAELQTDNDGEFVNPADPSYPSRFTLWLIGLGIKHVLSRPFRPTDQAHIERNHRTQGDFVWKDQTFNELEQFQIALDRERNRYNLLYPSNSGHCQGHPPLVAFPSAKFTGRPYDPSLEWDIFNLQMVDTFLAQFVWSRKVASNGTIHIGSHYYILGRTWKNKRVSLRFQPISREYRIEDSDGHFVGNYPIIGLEKEHLIGAIPISMPLPVGFQFALPLPGV